MRTILLLPQNDSHAETAALLDREFAGRGWDSVTLDMDGIYQQGTAPHLAGMTVLPSGLATHRPFYHMSPVNQMRVVAAAHPFARRWLDGVDGVVAFNDGALQRLILSLARQQEIATDLVLDGMITYLVNPLTPRSLARGALRSVGRWLDHTSVGAFFPSEVGLADVTRAHVAGQHSVEVLRSRGSRAGSLLATGLPRWPDAEDGAPERVRNVLYLTGAFRWHDDRANSDAQMRDVVALADACASLGLALTIRVHPRDDADQYSGLAATLVDPRTESITVTIRRMDLVLSIISTGLIEGVILGKPSRALVIHPRWSKYRRSFVADPVFGAIRDVDQLRAALVDMAAGVDRSKLDQQRHGLTPFVAATGAAATQRIVAAMAGAE